MLGHCHVLSCNFSPDGARLVSASDDRTLRIWDVETGRELAVLPLLWIPHSIDFAYDGPPSQSMDGFAG